MCPDSHGEGAEPSRPLDWTGPWSHPRGGRAVPLRSPGACYWPVTPPPWLHSRGRGSSVTGSQSTASGRNPAAVLESGSSNHIVETALSLSWKDPRELLVNPVLAQMRKLSPKERQGLARVTGQTARVVPELGAAEWSGVFLPVFLGVSGRGNRWDSKKPEMRFWLREGHVESFIQQTLGARRQATCRSGTTWV